MVIPALDEADRIEAAIRAVLVPGSSGGGAGCPAPPEVDLEVVVVDGGSADDTRERARRAGARVIGAARGRARQIEAGWRASAGEVVVFLHADTRLGDGWRAALCESLADPRVVGGAFRLRFDDDRPALRIIEAFVAFRVWLLGLPYGDQALFVRRRILEEMGGIPQVPLMEDLDVVAAMRARGRVVALPVPAITSARRYVDQGVWRTVGRHVGALLMWRAGVDRGRIARWLGR